MRGSVQSTLLDGGQDSHCRYCSRTESPEDHVFFFFSLMIANSTVLKPFVGDLKGVYIFGPSFSRFIGFEV